MSADGGGLSARKLRHIDACLTGPVEHVALTTGFERFELPYNALTQTRLAAIDLSTSFLGAPSWAPVLIGAVYLRPIRPHHQPQSRPPPRRAWVSG